jgi:hypothetical protein
VAYHQLVKNIKERACPRVRRIDNTENDNPLMPDSGIQSRYSQKKIFPVTATSAIIVAQPDQGARSLQPALPSETNLDWSFWIE